MLELTDGLQTVTVASKFYRLVGVVVFFSTLHQLFSTLYLFRARQLASFILGIETAKLGWTQVCKC